jgi:hypothetical protein
MQVLVQVKIMQVLVQVKIMQVLVQVKIMQVLVQGIHECREIQTKCLPRL